MSVSITNSAALIRPNVVGGITDLRGRPTDLLDWFEKRGAVRLNDGGAPRKWNILPSSTGAAETYVEFQGLPIPGQPAYGTASVPATYQRAVVASSGFVRDQIARGGYYPQQDAAQAAIDSAVVDLRVLVDATLAGSATDRGIASIVDSAELYAGIDPAGTPAWASLETAIAGALTIAVLNTMYRSMADAPRMASPTHLLMNTNQLLNYTNLFGFANATAARTNPRAEAGTPYDLGMFREMASFSGAPCVGIRSLAATELYMLDVSMGYELLEQRTTQVETLRLSADVDTTVVSRAWLPIVINRRQQGKLTGLTA